MPTYFFDVLKGDVISFPGEGVEFSSDEHAREYALGIVSTFRSEASERVSIRDEAGRLVDVVWFDNFVKGTETIPSLPARTEPDQ